MRVEKTIIGHWWFPISSRLIVAFVPLKWRHLRKKISHCRPYWRSGIVSSGNACERRSQSYFDSGNDVPRTLLNTYSPITALNQL